MIGVVSDPVFMNHDTGGYHPESPLRVQYIHTLFYEDAPGVVRVDPVKASIDDVLLNHDRGYIRSVADSCSSDDLVNLDMDTVCSEDSFDTALLAAGSTVKLTEMALNSEIDAGFSFVRPPGHHACRNAAMGFCLFNNIAIAAHKAIQSYGVRKVLIVDFDVHHGNGTQESFYSSSDVLYFSTHQHPFYPGTGSIADLGKGDGLGYTVNCPLRSGQKDGHFIAVYQSILSPIVEAFEPGLILVSAGFDAHASDPIGGMQVSARGFGAIAGLIQDAAREVSAPVVYVLEGGYNLNALKESIACVVDIVKGEAVPEIEALSGPELDAMFETHSRFWPLMHP